MDQAKTAVRNCLPRTTGIKGFVHERKYRPNGLPRSAGIKGIGVGR